VFERRIADLNGAEVLPSFIETGTIGTAAITGIGELNRVILPPADGAAEKRARWALIQRKAVAARAGKSHG